MTTNTLYKSRIESSWLSIKSNLADQKFIVTFILVIIVSTSMFIGSVGTLFFQSYYIQSPFVITLRCAICERVIEKSAR